MKRENLSTKNQPKGSGRNPSDTLDREQETVASGQRALNADSNFHPDTASGARNCEEARSVADQA